jgi:hypothetical protein
MKTFSGILFTTLAILILSGCIGKNRAKLETGAESDTIPVPDSVVKYFSKDLLLKEVSFRNGVRNGLTKTYYPGGQLYQTFWYVDDLKEDSAKWFYTEGQLFRATPYNHDTIDGIQKQYFRTGELRAKIRYKKGFRTLEFEEFTREGKVIKNYPEIVINLKDTYKTDGRYTLNLELSDKSTRVKFYAGVFTDEIFDTTAIKPIRTIEGKATLVLSKTGLPKGGNLGIIAEFTTPYSNRHFLIKNIELLYNDLN